MANPAKEYELFTQSVCQQLSNYHHIGITNIQHDIKLEGRSGCKHQIDVYWEYEKDGVKHRIVIECKNYNKRVSKDKVCAFQGVLADIDNNVEGILVTKIGFQKGAKKYAKEYGILLKELRPPKNDETIIGRIENHIHAEIRRRFFLIDEKWALEHYFNIARYKQKMEMFSFDNNKGLHVPLFTTDDVVRNSKGDYIVSLDTLEPEIPKQPTNDIPYILKFEDAYVTTTWGQVKILEVKYDFKVEDQQQNIAIDAGNFVKAVLKDALSDAPNTSLLITM